MFLRLPVVVTYAVEYAVVAAGLWFLSALTGHTHTAVVAGAYAFAAVWSHLWTRVRDGIEWLHRARAEAASRIHRVEAQ